MKDFLERLASDSPTPGGGSASAASGAIGAALLSMVYLISRKKIINSRKKEENNKCQLIDRFKDSADKAKKAMNKLLLLIDEDANAFENVLEKLKELKKVKTSEGKTEIDSSKVKINDSKEKNNISKVEIEINKAKEDLQKAYKHAVEIPFQIARLCYKILKNSENLSEEVAFSVKSDFQIAILLLKTGIKGASLNVDINLNEVEDKSYLIEKRGELNRIIKNL